MNAGVVLDALAATAGFFRRRRVGDIYHTFAPGERCGRSDPQQAVGDAQRP
jgi:hypothetical protein